jgi:hypothetical protein
MKVWAHSMVFPTRPLDVVNSGADVISHVCRLAWEGMEEAPLEYHHDQVPLYGNFSPASQVFTELFDAMRANGTILDATLAMYARAEANPDNPLSDRCDVDFARALVSRAAAEGLPIAAGTDFTAEDTDPFPALHEELEELVRGGGLTPMQAIESATRIAAEAIGVADRHGMLVHGRPVSMVLLNEDPIADISNLRSVRAVWKNAERFDRAAYRRPVAEDDRRPPTLTGPASAQDALDGWLRAWRRYDLDGLADVLLQDRALTYFANDEEGTLEGFDAVQAYYEGLGFVSGGFQPENELWLEDILIADFEETAVVSAVWHFGSRLMRTDAALGPFSMVVVRTSSGYRISHVNMGNYAPEG